MFRVGELDQKIDFWRECLEDDGMGGQKKSEFLIYSGRWAKVRSMSGGESERFDKLNAVGTCFFVTRRVDDIRENDFIKWRGVDYNIRMIPPQSMNSLYSEFYAERGVAL